MIFILTKAFEMWLRIATTISQKVIRKSLNPLTHKTIEIPRTPKTPFRDATLSAYCGANKGDRIFIIFQDPTRVTRDQG